MIVRERTEEFIMIEQHHHAEISGHMIHFWRKNRLRGQEAMESIILSAYQHDCGWKPADKQPFWNDKQLAPFAFTSFPTPLKTLIYKHGIDEVANKDKYAALLCSEHYTRFMLPDESEEAKAFVKSEKARQKKLVESLPEFDADLFEHHYSLLQLSDNLSLFICLNEPGKNEHPFFRKGIPLSPTLNLGEKMNPQWVNENMIKIDDFPFEKPFAVTLKQKVIRKRDIAKKGLINSYKEASFQEISIKLIP